MKYPRPRGFQDGENAVICQYTGFRVLSSQTRRDYNGVIVRRESADYRHPQEAAPITHEDSVPEISNPRQINFVDVDFIEDPSQERT